MSNESPAKEDTKAKEVQIDLYGLDCASCVPRIEKQLKRVRGIEDARVSYIMNRLYVTFDPSEINRSEIEVAIKKLGYRSMFERREGLLHGVLSRLKALYRV